MPVDVSVDGPHPFEPVALEARYPPPVATIAPDRSKGWVRRVWPVVRSHRLLFGSALAAAVAGFAVQVAIPRVVGLAIDEALTAGTGSLEGYVVVLAALGMARGGLGYVTRSGVFKTAYAIEYDLRTLMHEHLTRLSFSFYDRVQSGQLISRANSDIRALQMYLAFAPFVFASFSVFVFALALMLLVHVPLALVTVSTLPLVYWLGVRMRELMFPTSWIVQAQMADVATLVDENVNGVRVVKSFAGERHQIRLLARTAERLRWASVYQLDGRARYAPLLENLPRIGLALILLYGGWLATRGEVGVGDIVAFSAYVVMLQQPFRMLGFIIMMGQRAAASAQRIYEVLDEAPDIVERPGAVDLLDPRGEVTFEDASFVYPGRPPVLRGLTLHVPAGRTVAIVGRTGSGKTTIAQLLPRFYDIAQGRVAVDGHDVRDLTLASLRAAVGIVLDEPFLFSASVRDNIAFGRPGASFETVVAAARAAGAHEFIEELEHGYDTVVGERGYTLSGGQRQRIAIARALVQNPAVLILDDATSAIDVKVELEIHDALRRLFEGRTTLIIAHRLSTISLAERVVLLDDGRIVADGTHEELLRTEPRYAEVLAHLEEEDRKKAEAVEAEAAAETAAGDGMRRAEGVPVARGAGLTGLDGLAGGG